jgi:uncharacterized repeat protein (TIGR03803 family)
VQGSDGYLYGTSLNGGANGLSGLGTVFKISLSGTLTPLHSFIGDDGESPYGGLVQASDGNFYGTAYGGGANSDGTVFTITSTGNFTTLHTFAGASDGAYPYAALVQATDGNFYGTTFEGGTHGLGTVFKMTPSGALSTLHNFAGSPSDGSLSTSALLELGPNLYGTTGIGGNPSYGIVFHLTIPRLCTVCPNAE